MNLNDWLADAHRIRCISNRNTGRYHLRIEDAKGNPLSEFAERSAAESRYALQLSIFPLLTPKEDLCYPEYNVEDYRLPIVSEDIVRARLYPKE